MAKTKRVGVESEEDEYVYKEAGRNAKGEVHVGDLREEIDNLEDLQPKDKRTKEYENWKKRINKTMDTYNKAVKWKAYKMVQ